MTDSIRNATGLLHFLITGRSVELLLSEAKIAVARAYHQGVRTAGMLARNLRITSNTAIR